MKSGQRLTRWWQEYVLGQLTTPRHIFRSALSEIPDQAQASDRFFTEPTDGPFWVAPERLKAPSYWYAPGYLTQCDKADWQQVDRRLMRWSAIFIELARKRGIPLYTHCAFRTEAEQAKASSGGNSKAAYPRSAHNIGEAVDIVHGVYHWTMTEKEWSLLHVLGLRALDLVNAQLLAKPSKNKDGTFNNDAKLSLTWGGTFKGLYDPAHWEITDYRNRIQRLPVGSPVRYTPRKILGDIKL